jgi:hypothetical protein
MKRVYVDLSIASLLLVVLVLLGMWQRLKLPGTDFLLSYNYAVWAAVSAVAFAICCLFVWNLLRQQQTIWLNLCEIILILLCVHVVAIVLSTLFDRGQDLITLAWFTLMFMLVPSIASSLTVLAAAGIIGRLIRR